MSNFAILRIQKLKSHLQITQACKHNYRLIPCSSKINDNRVSELHGDSNAPKHAKKILSTHKIRANAVYGLEIVLTASPTYFRDELSPAGTYDFSALEKLESEVVSFLSDNFGEENIISTVCHTDETTPHWHCLFIPVDPKGKLNAQHWIGTPQKLRDLQSDWASRVLHLGLIRGNPSKSKKNIPLKLYRSFKEIFVNWIFSFSFDSMNSKNGSCKNTGVRGLDPSNADTQKSKNKNFNQIQKNQNIEILEINPNSSLSDLDRDQLNSYINKGSSYKP